MPSRPSNARAGPVTRRSWWVTPRRSAKFSAGNRGSTPSKPSSKARGSGTKPTPTATVIDFAGAHSYIGREMQVTRAGEYAIIGLLYLARQPDGTTVMIDEISDAE